MPPLPPPPPSDAFPVVGVLLAVITAILILTGMILGFRALHDIRVSNGTLGGAMMATFAAGLLPALFIVAACCAAVMLLGQGLTANRLNHGVLLLPGSGAGVWLSFLMMRAMHREATGWMPPALDTVVVSRSGCATSAIVLTIIGSALTLVLFLFVLPGTRRSEVYDWHSRVNQLLVLDFAVLLAGFICGVLARREAAGRTCTWISGALFVLFLLIVAG